MHYEIVKRPFDSIPKLFKDLVLIQNNLPAMNMKEFAWDWFKQPFQILFQLLTVLQFQNSWFQGCGSYLHCWVQASSLFDDVQQPYCSLSQNSMQLLYFYGMLPPRDSSQLLLKSVLFSFCRLLIFLKLCLCDDKIRFLLLFSILYRKTEPTISIFSSGAEHRKLKNIFALLLAFINSNEELLENSSIFAFV